MVLDIQSISMIYLPKLGYIHAIQHYYYIRYL